ncbi:hypothetical protein [Halomonas llamarensis]|uniref:Uncharacterized protein n=1 Tax=Halomonas llamarensis TaxID=2945104 RepID=A0ABT0SN34_9GAMM|nr:hypothetical protein [Halomonas llamarensis]MCL7929152.1 hypothetical protein [Halomonas llamarensis]
MSCVFHYSNLVQKLPPVLNSGQLLPHADTHVETPLLWFSAHPFWEPTATKPCWTGGTLVNLKFWEYRDLFGCVRFALPADDNRLMTWREACNYACLPRNERRKLEAAARKRGGDPKQWFAVPVAIPLTDVKLEVLSGNTWRAIS